jgi:hypothetical protein
MTAAAAPAVFEMGRVISRTFRLLGEHWRVLVPVAIAIVGVPAAALGLLEVRLLNQIDKAAMSAGITRSLLRLSVTYGVSMLHSSLFMVLNGVAASLAAPRQAAGGTLASRVGLASAPALFGMGLIAYLAIFGGTLLLIVPGVLISLAWSVNGAALATERLSILGALRRSVELTRGYRGAILGVAIVYSLAGGVITAAVLFGTGAIRLGPPITYVPSFYFATDPILYFLRSLVVSCGLASIYQELRSLKEGVAAGGMADIFD